MRNDKNIPAGLFALTLPLICSGVHTVFGLMVIMAQRHGDVVSPAGQAAPMMLLLVKTFFFVILTVGMILLYRAAFIIYVIYFGCHCVLYLKMAAFSGQDNGILSSTAAVIYLMVILGALYYRPFFFEQENEHS
jgi:hypothetical protein